MPGFGLCQNEGERFSLVGRVLDRLAVAGVNDGKCLKGAGGFADADEDAAEIVHFKCSAEFVGLVRPELVVAGVVHDEGVGLAEIVPTADEHFLGSADEGVVVEAEEDHLLEIAVVEAGAGQAFVEADGPIDAGDAADTVEIVFGHGLDVVDELHVGIHDPNAGAFQVFDLAGGAEQQAAKNGGLLGDEQRGKGDTEDDAQVFGPVTDQHFPGDPSHDDVFLVDVGLRRWVGAVEPWGIFWF